jgi:hypothetical protein
VGGAVLEAEKPVPDPLSPPEEELALTPTQLETEGEVATPLYQLHPLYINQPQLTTHNITIVNAR